MEKGSSSSSYSGGGGDSINGLKFGKKIYFEGVGSKIAGGLLPKEEEAELPRSPAKKGRTAVVQGGQPPRCQVEGCQLDLSDSKAYYCRHKVCGMHSKSPMVIVAGIQQRFCQQCSRFHQLSEFDQGKRSCRRRLAGHNERRRKPPPGPLLSSSRYATHSPSISDDHSKSRGPETEVSTYSSFAGREHGFSGFQLLPWQIHSQGPPTRYGGAEDCLSGISDSRGALSLLSNEPWGSRSHALDLGVNTVVPTDSVAGLEPSPDSSRYSSCPLWEFKGGDHSSLHHEMPWPLPLPLPLPSHSHTTNTPHSRDLRLAPSADELQPSASGYDSSSTHHMNWSL